MVIVIIIFFTSVNLKQQVLQNTRTLKMWQSSPPPSSSSSPSRRAWFVKIICRNAPAMFIVLYFPPHKQDFYGAITLIESNVQHQRKAQWNNKIMILQCSEEKKAGIKNLWNVFLWFFKSIFLVWGFGVYVFGAKRTVKRDVYMYFSESVKCIFLIQ